MRVVWLSGFVLLFTLALAGVFLRGSQTQEDIGYLESIRLGGEWFLNNQDETFLRYEYDPVLDAHPDSDHPLREMASLWSISRLDGFLNDTRYSDLAHKGFKHYEGYFVYDGMHDFIYVNITPSDNKLGYSAFMILTLLELEHPKRDYYLEKFANGIVHMQNPDGSLRTIFYSNKTRSVDYYPGESLFALMALYEHRNEVRYLEAVEKAFPYYVTYFRGNPNTAFVPWQTRAYTRLHRATGRREVADFVFEMNDYMLDQHTPEGGCSGYNLSRGIVTAVYVEGVNEAYRLAGEAGDEKRRECYGNFIKEALDYITLLQITEDDGFGEEAVGGFISDTSATMRVDRNQHAVTALMEAYELGIKE